MNWRDIFRSIRLPHTLSLWPTALLLMLPPLPFAQQIGQLTPADTGVQTMTLASARAHINAGNFADAETQLRRVLSISPASADARSMLGSVLFREHKAAASLAEYTALAKLRQPTASELKIVALDYVLLDDYADADRWMEMALKEEPNDADGWYDLGRIKYTQNRFAEAMAAFEKNLQLAPRTVKTKNNMGLSLEGLNRNDEAIAAYREAMAWQKDSPHPSEQPMLNLGIILVNRGELDEALPLLLKAAQIAPKDQKIHEQLGRLYLKKEDLLQARQEMETATTLAPDLASLHFQLGQVYKRLGLTEKARDQFARVKELSGTHSSPHSY